MTAQQILRREFQTETRPAGDGMEKRWQELLNELDDELVLRWCPKSNQWAVYYDHNNIISVICTIPVENCQVNFGKSLEYLKRNAYTTLNEMKRQYLAAREYNDKQRQQKIDDAAKEFEKGINNIGKVTSSL